MPGWDPLDPQVVGTSATEISFLIFLSSLEDICSLLTEWKGEKHQCKREASIDCFLIGTQTGDHMCPDQASILQRRHMP